MKIEYNDIKDKKEFVFDGDLLIQKECVDEDNKIYVYERYYQGSFLYAYEVVRGIKRKNPSGRIIYKYPSSEEFGKYGYFLPVKSKNRIPEYVKMLQDSIKK